MSDSKLKLKQLNSIRSEAVKKGPKEVDYNEGCLAFGIVFFTILMGITALIIYEFEEDAYLMPFIIVIGSFITSVLPAYAVSRLATYWGMVSNIKEPTEIDWGNMFRKDLLDQAIQPILTERLPELKPLKGPLAKEQDWSEEDQAIMKIVRRISGLNNDISAWRWADLRYSLSQTKFVRMEDGGASMTWGGYHPRACINYWCMLMPFETGEAKALITPTTGGFWAVYSPGDEYKLIPSDFEKFKVYATHPDKTTEQLKKLIYPLRNLCRKIGAMHWEFKESQSDRNRKKRKDELDLSGHITIVIAENRLFLMLLAMREYLSPIPIKTKLSKNVLKKYNKELDAIETFFRETREFSNSPKPEE